MKKLYLLSLVSLYCAKGISQITGPDTVISGTSATFSTLTDATTYSWILNNVNIAQTPSALSLSASGSPINDPVYATMNNDSGKWYSFVTNFSTNEIIRVSYGSNPNSGTPTMANLGTFGLTSGLTEGISIIREKQTGYWYGFVVSYNQLLRLNFGTHLSNTPTDTIIDLTPYISYPHQIEVKQYGSLWVGFIGNRTGTGGLTRLDFGTSITSVPTATNLPIVGSMTEACNFALYQESGNWYMLVTNLQDNSLTRVNFGSNIQNNLPTGNYLHNPGGLFSIPRSIAILRGCNNVIAYETNEGGELIKLDFGSSITDSPTVTDMGPLPSGNTLNAFTTYVYDSSQYFLQVSSHTNELYHYKVMTFPQFDTSAYYHSSFTHTFTTTGLYNMTLYCDQAFYTGPSTYCKSVYVKHSLAVNQIPSAENKIITYPNPANDEWCVSIPQGNEKMILNLYSADGRLVKVQNLTEGTNTLHLADLNTGVYFYRVVNNNEVYTGKLQKQ